MLRELRGALTALALVVTALLLAASVDLGIPGQPLLQTIRFHIAAGLVLVAALLLLSGAWRRMLLFLVVAGLSVGQGATTLLRQQETRTFAGADAATPLLKLLSFNILDANRANGKAIADFVAASGADVAMLMEAQPVAPYLDVIAKAYPYRVGCDPGRLCDSVVFSKTEFTSAQVLSMSKLWSDRLIVARTTIGGESITLVEAHLVKPYFDGFGAEEANVLRQVIEAQSGPLLLAGDFNAAAWSDSIEQLSRSAGLMPGPAYPATWPTELGPFGVPIDNVFSRAPLLIRSVRALDDTMGSNHRALWIEVSLAR